MDDEKKIKDTDLEKVTGGRETEIVEPASPIKVEQYSTWEVLPTIDMNSMADHI